MAERACATCQCFTPQKAAPPGVDLAAAGVSNVGRCHRFPAIVSKAPHDFCFEWRPSAALKKARK